MADSADNTASPFVRMVGITKTFGKVCANRNVTFTVHGGEIYALLGENGAGKSTLMNILSGIYRPDGGSIFIHGRERSFRSPRDSIESGIGMIHQHFKLVDVLSAKENIVLGMRRGGRILRGAVLSREIRAICDRFGLSIDPDKRVRDMSVGEKQTVEILKVLYRGADILILDEPTAVLTPAETRKLFAILRRMKEGGCAVVIITHKLHEVMEISDRVTVMRKGETVGSVRTSETSPRELTNLMVGRRVELSIERPEARDGKVLLEVRDLTVTDREGFRRLRDVSFSLRAGEMLGVAGVAGSGQRELCESIQGLHPVTSGDILYETRSIVGLGPRAITELGICMSFIPEDRLGMGLVPSMDMVDNVILKDYYRCRGLMLDRKPGEAKARDIISRLRVQTPGVHHPIKQLSGGNIQKVLLGREIDADPHVLVTAYATRGLDIGSSHVIYDQLNEQKQRGVGILYVGEDLDVLLALCDRILVLYDGRVTGIVDARSADKEQVGLLMTGEMTLPFDERGAGS